MTPSMLIYRLIGQLGRVFANGPGDLGSIPGRVIPKTLKMALDPPCLILSNIRYMSRVTWSNPGKGVAPSPTPRCSSYWKESLLVALDYYRLLLFLFKTKKIVNSYFWRIDVTLTGIRIPRYSGPGSNGNEGLLHTSQSLTTKWSLVWYPGYRFWGDILPLWIGGTVSVS